MRLPVTLTSGTLAIFLACGSLSAHHGAALFDSKTITLKGAVTDYRFTNPHVLIFVTVRTVEGKSELWRGELTGPGVLSDLGWSRNTLKAGDQITIIGHPDKAGTHIIAILRLFAPTGDELKVRLSTE